MGSPSNPRPPAGPSDPARPTTQEIPVVRPTAGATATHQLPPHPGAAPPVPVQPVAAAVEAPQPTGPVDFVPGLPGLVSPPPPAPSASAAGSATGSAQPSWPETLENDSPDGGRSEKIGTRALGDRTALLGLGLVVLALVLLELGLALDFGAESYWSIVPLWSAFATFCALLGLLAFASFYVAGNRLRAEPVWRVAAGGLLGLAVFWLLVVLPAADTDRGFVLTAALAALGGALWIGPRSKA